MSVFTVKRTERTKAEEQAYAAILAKLALTYGLARKGDPDAVVRIASIREAAKAGDARAQAAWRAMSFLHTRSEKSRAKWAEARALAERAAAGDEQAISSVKRIERKAAAGDPEAKAKAAKIGCCCRKIAQRTAGIAVGGIAVGRALSESEHAELYALMQRAIESIPNWKLFVQSGLGTASSSSTGPKAGSFADAYFTDKGDITRYTKADGTINRNALMIQRRF